MARTMGDDLPPKVVDQFSFVIFVLKFFCKILNGKKREVFPDTRKGLDLGPQAHLV